MCIISRVCLVSLNKKRAEKGGERTFVKKNSTSKILVVVVVVMKRRTMTYIIN